MHRSFIPVRLTLLALAALVLAGCAHPASQATGPPAAPDRVRYSIPVHGTVSAQDAIFCPPATTCPRTYAVDLEQMKENQTAISFRLDIAVESNGGTPPQPVHVELRCSGDRACAQPLAQADGTGPFHLEGALDLPPRTVLTLAARVPDTTPDPLGLRQPFLTADGAIGVDALPGPALRIERVPIAYEGVAGLCVPPPAEADCYSIPYGMFLDVPLNGTLLRLHVTATWTPTSPASDTMRLVARCNPCPTMEVAGPSPLLADLAPANVHGGTLELGMQWTTPTGQPARQPYHLEGWLEVEVGAEDGG